MQIGGICSQNGMSEIFIEMVENVTQKAQSPQQLIPSGETSQPAQLLSRSAVSGFTDMPST